MTEDFRPFLKEAWAQRVVIDGMAWIPRHILSDIALAAIKTQLTVSIKVREGRKTRTNKVEMYIIEDFWVGVPRAYFERTSRSKLPVEHLVSAAESERIKTCGIEPRDDMQIDAVNVITERLKSREVTQVIICAATGVGKTILSLVIASKLGLKTLIVAPLTNLLDQWETRISSTVNDEDPSAPCVLPDAKVGRFSGDRREYGANYDVVLATTQTLCRCDPSDPIFQWPGLLIVDEVHFMGAAQWCTINHRFNATKRLGLTATPRRADGGERLFFEHLGAVGWRGAKPMMGLDIRRIDTGCDYNDSLMINKVEGMISRDLNRSIIIADEICKALVAGRKPLVLSKQINHLAVICSIVSHRLGDAYTYGTCCGRWPVNPVDASKYHLDKKAWRKLYKKRGKWALPEGANPDDYDIKLNSDGNIESIEPSYIKITKEVFESSKSDSIIFATYSMVAVGFDVTSLDTLFVTMPMSDMEQSVGRILRKNKEKMKPLVVHFVDNYKMSYIFWGKASKTYDLLSELGSGED